MGLKDKIESFPYIDKIVNFIIGLVLYIILSTTMSPKLTIFVILLIAIGKEIFDWYMEDWTNVEIYDLLAVMCGAVLACFFF